jgi:hypothetical protein
LPEGVFYVAVDLSRLAVADEPVERDALIGDLASTTRTGNGPKVADAMP